MAEDVGKFYVEFIVLFYYRGLNFFYEEIMIFRESLVELVSWLERSFNVFFICGFCMRFLG